MKRRIIKKQARDNLRKFIGSRAAKQYRFLPTTFRPINKEWIVELDRKILKAMNHD